jgi:TPR repeat protein
MRARLLLLLGILAVAGCTTPAQQACTGKVSPTSAIMLVGTPLLREWLSSPDNKAARCLLLSTDKETALELAARLRVGIGMPKRPGVAQKGYESFAASRGGTIFVHSPGINGAAGTTIAVNTGPIVPGDRRAIRELGIMLIGGEAGKPKLKEGWKLIRQAAAAGDPPAQAMLTALPKA